jgi:hypothetical protein
MAQQGIELLVGIDTEGQMESHPVGFAAIPVAKPVQNLFAFHETKFLQLIEHVLPCCSACDEST